MSSDVYASKQALVEVGVEFTSWRCGYSGEYEYEVRALFPNYQYYRQVDMVTDEQVHIVCGGDFRDWLFGFLKDNDIVYEVL